MLFRNKLVVIFFILSVFAVVDYATASTWRPDSSSSFMVTLTVIIAVIALIAAFFFLASGIKYVTPENVLDTEIRKI